MLLRETPAGLLKFPIYEAWFPEMLLYPAQVPRARRVRSNPAALSLDLILQVVHTSDQVSATWETKDSCVRVLVLKHKYL